MQGWLTYTRSAPASVSQFHHCACELVTACYQLSGPPFGVAFALPENAQTRHNKGMPQTCAVCCKQSFTDRTSAKLHMLASGKAWVGMELYVCPVGSGLHFGHSRKARKRPPVREHRRDRMLTLPPQALAKEYANYA